MSKVIARSTLVALSTLVGVVSCVPRATEIHDASLVTVMTEDQEQPATALPPTVETTAVLSPSTPPFCTSMPASTAELQPSQTSRPTSMLVTPVATGTSQPTRAPLPTATPPVFQHLRVAVSEFIGSEGEPGYDDYHPAVLSIFSDSNPEPEFVLAADDTSYYDPIWSPDGEWLAYVERQGDETMSIHVVGSDWQHHSRLTPDFDFVQLNNWVDYLSIRDWSADSRWLAFDHVTRFGGEEKGYESTTYVVNRETGDMHLVGHDVTALAWSPCEPEHLVFAITPWDEYRASVYAATLTELDNVECVVCGEPELNEKEICSIAWSPDGQRLALTEGSDCLSYSFHLPHLWVLEADTWELQAKRQITLAAGVAWSTDGRWLVRYNSQRLIVDDTTDWSAIRTVDVSQTPWWSRAKWIDTGALIYTQPTESAYRLLMLQMPDGEPQILWEPSMAGLDDRHLGFLDWHVE